MKSNSLLNNRRFKDLTAAYILVLPCAAVLIVMMIYPIIQVIQFAFSQVTILNFQTQFVGFQNFVRIVKMPDFRDDALHTLIWTIESMALRFILGIACALLIDTSLRGMKVFRVLSILPWIMPSIVAANLWRWIYNTDYGILNYAMGQLIPHFKVDWLGTPGLALQSVLAAFSWMGFPFVMLMLLAGLQGILNDLKEAARIDGANGFQVIVHIIIPCLRTIILTLFALQLIDGVNSFDLLYTLTAGGPGGSSEIFSLQIFRVAFENFDYGGAAALSVMVILLVGIPMAIVAIVASIRNRRANRVGG